jgi:hypothetical protein
MPAQITLLTHSHIYIAGPLGARGASEPGV